jgi:hypothetical protein
MPVSFGFYKNFRSSVFRDPGITYGDYFVFNYNVTDGNDLDIRFRFINPYISAEYIGWGAQDRITANGNDIAFWGGDNTGLGRETVYIDRAALFRAFPGLTSVELDLRGFWYTTVGNNPVILNMDAYQGGKMVKNGFLWTNPTATNSFPASRSFPNTISFKTQNANSEGQRIARAIIDFDEEIITYYAT